MEYDLHIDRENYIIVSPDKPIQIGSQLYEYLQCKDCGVWMFLRWIRKDETRYQLVYPELGREKQKDKIECDKCKEYVRNMYCCMIQNNTAYIDHMDRFFGDRFK